MQKSEILMIVVIFLNVVFLNRWKKSVKLVEPTMFCLVIPFFLSAAAFIYYLFVRNSYLVPKDNEVLMLLVAGVASGIFYFCFSKFLSKQDLSSAYPFLSVGTIIGVVLAGIILLGESIVPERIIGFLLGIPALYFLMKGAVKKEVGKNEKANKLLLWGVLASVFNTVFAILWKKNINADNIPSFCLVAAGFILVTGLISYLFSSSPRVLILNKNKILPVLIICGITDGLFFLAYSYVLIHQDVARAYPFSSIGAIVLVFMLDVIKFIKEKKLIKEKKISFEKVIGLIFGVTALYLLLSK